MSDDLERALASSGRRLRAPEGWSEAVWQEINAGATEVEPVRAAAVSILPRVLAEVAQTRGPKLRLVDALDTRAAEDDVDMAPGAPILAARLLAAGTAFAMAAAMILVLLSQSQSAVAEKRLQIAAAKIEKLQVEIDLKLQEIDLEHEEGRAAFRQLYYAKGEASRGQATDTSDAEKSEREATGKREERRHGTEP